MKTSNQFKTNNNDYYCKGPKRLQISKQAYSTIFKNNILSFVYIFRIFVETEFVLVHVDVSSTRNKHVDLGYSKELKVFRDSLTYIIFLNDRSFGFWGFVDVFKVSMWVYIFENHQKRMIQTQLRVLCMNESVLGYKF